MRGIHPPVLTSGSRVAVTCPASPVVDPERLAKGTARLREAGFDVVAGESCAVREGLWAGSDEARAKELIDFLLDPTIEAIFAGRGGVGSMRLLPRLEDLPREIAPKWIVGRSDLTALHLAFWNRFQLVGLSGPMIATDFGGDAPGGVLADTMRILTDPEPVGLLTADSVEIWRNGSAEGVLIPANLSLISSMVGTRHIPPLAGAILVLEEIGEPPHRCDRMLTQLRLSGALNGLAGLVFGQFTDCAPHGADPSPGALADLLRDHADEIGAPTLAGFPYGHEPAFRPLPVGVRARMSADPPGLILLDGVGAPRAGRT
jgi:muramoyltetrapeptide carboxypeptidase